jgi:hypothetical protein
METNGNTRPAVQVDPGRVIAHLQARLAALLVDVAVKDAYIERLEAGLAAQVTESA